MIVRSIEDSDWGRKMKDILNWIGVSIFLGVGLYALMRPREMQKRAVEAGKNLKFNPFGRYIKSESYVRVTRISGAIIIIVAILVALLMIRGN